MKILDMLGAGLVVLAAKYYAISELIRDNDNGVLFRGSRDLTYHILRLMDICQDDGYPSLVIENNQHLKTLAQFLEQVCTDGGLTWTENWNETMKPLILQISSCPNKVYPGLRYFYSITLISILLIILAYLSRHIVQKQSFQ